MLFRMLPASPEIDLQHVFLLTFRHHPLYTAKPVLIIMQILLLLPVASEHVPVHTHLRLCMLMQHLHNSVFGHRSLKYPLLYNKAALIKVNPFRSIQNISSPLPVMQE